MAMVAVTALAMVGLAVGWRFHFRLRHEYVRTDQARRAEEQARRHAEAYLVLQSHGAGRTRVLGQQCRAGRAAAGRLPPSAPRLGVELSEAAVSP